MNEAKSPIVDEPNIARHMLFHDQVEGAAAGSDIMIDTKAYAFFVEQGWEILADLSDWQGMNTRQLADVARRYAVEPKPDGNLPGPYVHVQCPFTVSLK